MTSPPALRTAFETCLQLSDGLAIAEFADKPLPTPRNLRRRRQQVAQRDPRAGHCSRRSSPARSPASPFRDRAAAVLLQQPVRRLPGLRWPWHREDDSRQAWWCRTRRCRCAGRHRALGEVRQHLALLHPDAGSARQALWLQADRNGTSFPMRCSNAILRGTGSRRSTSSMTTVCAPTRPRRPFEGVIPISSAAGRKRIRLGARGNRALHVRDPCPACNGYRLKPEALAVKINGCTSASHRMSIRVANDWFDELPAAQ
jgi:excinuclease ABC subunit A